MRKRQTFCAEENDIAELGIVGLPPNETARDFELFASRVGWSRPSLSIPPQPAAYFAVGF
jgi:hypothetical protein